MINLKNLFFQKACPDWLVWYMANLYFFFKLLVSIFKALLNQEKMHIIFLETLLPQALWVAGK